MIFEKRIPTILAILILIAGIFGAVRLMGTTTRTTTKASPTAQIKEVVLTNVSDSGFTISWLTDGEFGQYVVIPESSKKNFCLPEYSSSSGPCYFDDRDVETHVPSKNRAHHVTIDGLSASSNYSIKIYTSGDGSAKTFKEIDGAPIATGPTIDGVLSSAVIYGNFYSSDGKLPAEGALIYLISDKGSKISTISKSSGSWLLTLNKLRSQNLDKYLSLGENELFTLEVKTGSGVKTEIKTTILQSQPLININLGSQELFDFSTNVVIPTPVPTTAVAGNKKTGFVVATPNTMGGNIPLSLTNPSENSSVDNLPTFRGTADPGQMVTIEVHSDTPINAEVKTDENGNWFWTPPSNLAPGEHTVTITVIDKNGNRQMVTKTFTVLANVNTLPVTAGSESAQVATPPPTTRPELTPEPTPQPTIQPAPEPTLIPSFEPTPAVISREVPVTASFGPFIILLTSGVLFATMGLWLFFNRKRVY